MVTMASLVVDDGMAIFSASKGFWGDAQEASYVLHFGVEVAEDSPAAHAWVERLVLSSFQYVDLETFLVDTCDYFQKKTRELPVFPPSLEGCFSDRIAIYDSAEEGTFCVRFPPPAPEDLMVAPLDMPCGYVSDCVLLVKDVLAVLRGAM